MLTPFSERNPLCFTSSYHSLPYFCTNSCAPTRKMCTCVICLWYYDFLSKITSIPILKKKSPRSANQRPPAELRVWGWPQEEAGAISVGGRWFKIEIFTCRRPQGEICSKDSDIKMLNAGPWDMTPRHGFDNGNELSKFRDPANISPAIRRRLECGMKIKR